MAHRPFSTVLLAFVLCCCAWSVAETPDQVRNPKKTANVWVSDGAHVLDAATERRINALIAGLERQTTAEIAVVTIRRTDGRTPKQFATLLFNRWGVGKRNKNNGVLLLVVLDARRVEVETGRGMSRVLPDSRVQRILSERVVPRFREDDYAGGILAGVQALAQIIAHPPSSAAAPRPAQQQPLLPPARSAAPAPEVAISFDDAPEIAGVPPWAPIAGGALLLPLGYGAYRRLRVRRCVRCGQAMRRLDEVEDDLLLASDQRFEEGLGSVDYRVWRCDRCPTSHIERAVKWFSGYGDCPRCRHRTLREHTDVLRHPTYDWPGEALVTRACRFPGCGFLNREQRILPRRERPSRTTHVRHHHHTSSSSSSRGSSSSGGSFGGGSSSGGGAGANW